MASKNDLTNKLKGCKIILISDFHQLNIREMDDSQKGYQRQEDSIFCCSQSETYGIIYKKLI